jgi:hypothetical protein
MEKPSISPEIKFDFKTKEVSSVGISAKIPWDTAVSFIGKIFGKLKIKK